MHLSLGPYDLPLMPSQGSFLFSFGLYPYLSNLDAEIFYISNYVVGHVSELVLSLVGN